MRNILLAVAAAILTSLVSRAAELSSGSAEQRISRYSVIWNTPSKDASGQMPIGNGDIAAGVYAIENGDLYLLLAKNDAYTYQGDLFKTGRVRISLDPNPFKSGKPFRQTLDLPTGSVRIEADAVTLLIWADARRPVCHVQIISPHDIAVTARPEFWKRFDHCPSNQQGYTPAGAKDGAEPTPDVAGLQYCLDGLLALKAGTKENQARWQRFRGEIPELYLRTSEGRQAIAPARKWEHQSNMENAELYAVFPFRCFGLAHGSGDLVAWTMKQRTVKDAFNSACWTQDQIHWAYAGNATEAADGLVRRFRVASPMCRFPLFGREGPDSCPDFDHFGAGSIALQRMLVQEAGAKILLLPAWPADWDVDFTLRVSQRTILTGTVKAGRLTTWDTHPASRKKDVVVGQPQPRKPLGPVVK